MRWKDRIQFIQQNMKKNKSRLFMTILATAIGCAFLIVLASVGFGAQRFITKDLLQDQSVTAVTVQGKKTGNEGEANGITAKDIERFQSIDHVKTVTKKLFVQNNSTVHLQEYQGNPQVSAMDFSAEKKAGLKLSKGHLPENENEVVVGYHFAESLHKQQKDSKPDSGSPPDEKSYTGDLLGKQVQWKVKQFFDGKEKTKAFPLKVVGITEAPARDWMKNQDVYITESMLNHMEDFTKTPLGIELQPSMPKDQKQEIKNEKERTYSDVKIIANDMENVDAISKKLKEEGYYIYSVTEELDQVNLIFAVVKSGLVIIGLIALLIASIGIYNTMSMAVTERTHEIGVMKAIGGTPKLIRSIFLMESSYIGLVGAIVGVLAAYLVSFGINKLLPYVIKGVFHENLDQVIQLSYIPFYLVLICVVLSMGVAMLSGMKPAKKATKIDVLSALRRDI